jgi:hypothetical protein
MKRFFSLVVVLALALSFMLMATACSSNKETSSTVTTGLVCDVKKDDDGNKYAVATKYSLSDEDSKKVSAGDYADLMVDLVINEYEVDGEKIPVKEIEASAFANSLVIKKLTIGENVETVGLACLSGCSNLEELVLNFVGATDDAVNEKKTLAYLFGTTSFTGGTATSVVTSSGGSSTTYYFPESLKKVTVTGDKIPDFAFYGTALEEVTMTGAVTTIGEGAFSYMTELTTIRIPSTVKEIGKSAFSQSTALYKVEFVGNAQLETIWQEAFSGCSMLGYGNNLFVLPSSLTKIYEGAFKNCTNLKTIDLTSTKITAIPTACFYGCTKLTEVKYNEGTTIGNDAIPETANN